MFRTFLATLLCVLAMSTATIAYADTAALTMKLQSGVLNGQIDCLALNGLDFERVPDPSRPGVIVTKVGTIQCVKKIDGASPRLMQALLGNEDIRDAELILWGLNHRNEQVQIAKVNFTGGKVTQLQQTLATTSQPAQEVVAFTFERATLVVGAGSAEYPR